MEYPVRIQPQFPRWMRKRSGSGPPNADYIRGLIDLYQAAGKLRVIAEIGCWTGESSEIACQFADHLFCVDPWECDDDHEDVFDRRMAAYSNVTKMKMKSVDAAKQFYVDTLDLVYIDGMHDYENVKSDILAWIPIVRPDGWITGHDYDGMSDHVGVVKAVNELLGEPKRRYSDSSWAFKKKEISCGLAK